MAHKAQVVVQPQPGLFERISETLNLNALSKKISANKHTLVDIGLFGAIGFIIGFLCKNSDSNNPFTSSCTNAY